VNRLQSVIVLGWLLIINVARSGPPFVTDDPEPPSVGGWEINLPVALDHTHRETEMETRNSLAVSGR
jgi:hypothetical protein